MKLRCDYCYRPRFATVYLGRGWLATLLGRPRRMRFVCKPHFDKRGFHG